MRMSDWFGRILTAGDASDQASDICHRIGLIRTIRGKQYVLPIGARMISSIKAMITDKLPPASSVHMPAIRRWINLAPLLSNEILSYRQLPVWLHLEGTGCPGIDPDLFTGNRPDAGIRWLMVSDQESIRKPSYWTHAVESFFDEAGFSEIVRIDAPGRIEWFLIHEDGSDVLLECSQCGWLGRGEFHPLAGPSTPAGTEPEEDLREIATPGVTTIEDLAEFLDIRTDRIIKTLLLESEQGLLVQILIRGDRTVSIPKVEQKLEIRGLRAAGRHALEKSGASAGYVGPVNDSGFNPDRVLTDNFICEGINYTAGANRAGFHFSGVRMGRDFSPGEQGDFSTAAAGSTCNYCGGSLEDKHGEKLAGWYWRENIFSLSGTDGARFGVGAGLGTVYPLAILPVLAERGLKDGRMHWPDGMEPFQVYLVSIQQDEESEQLYDMLNHEGISVFYDDRDVRPGVKFNDADLMGSPFRVTISSRSLEKGGLEVFTPSSGTKDIVKKTEFPAILAG